MSLRNFLRGVAPSRFPSEGCSLARGRPLALLPKAVTRIRPSAWNGSRRVPLGITEELTGRQRGRLFGYREYIVILNEGTEV